MYTSRLKDGRKKDKDATTNLFTRLLYLAMHKDWSLQCHFWYSKVDHHF